WGAEIGQVSRTLTVAVRKAFPTDKTPPSWSEVWSGRWDTKKRLQITTFKPSSDAVRALNMRGVWSRCSLNWPEAPLAPSRERLNPPRQQRSLPGQSVSCFHWSSRSARNRRTSRLLFAFARPERQIRVEIHCDLAQSIGYNAIMSFADFPEQQQVVQLLQRSLQRGRLAHAYLFTGGDLPELEAVAQTLAKTLNCQQPRRRESGHALDSCDQCLGIRGINGALHPDVHWVRPESKLRIITVDQMRDLMAEVHLKPTEAKFKVAIMVGADRLNASAANAFLKPLEEPPARSILILLSTEPQRILETMLSRCLRLNFAGESGPRFDEAQTRWLTTFGEAASGEQKSLLGRYRLLGTLVSRLAQIKADIESSLAARSPLERYDDVDPRLREKWEEELSAAIE